MAFIIITIVIVTSNFNLEITQDENVFQMNWTIYENEQTIPSNMREDFSWLIWCWFSQIMLVHYSVLLFIYCLHLFRFFFLLFSLSLSFLSTYRSELPTPIPGSFPYACFLQAFLFLSSSRNTFIGHAEPVFAIQSFRFAHSPPITKRAISLIWFWTHVISSFLVSQPINHLSSPLTLKPLDLPWRRDLIKVLPLPSHSKKLTSTWAFRHVMAQYLSFMN
jgi:hypothetical protein